MTIILIFLIFTVLKLQNCVISHQIFYEIATVGDVAKIMKANAKDSIENNYYTITQALQLLFVEPEEFKELCVLNNILPIQINQPKYRNTLLYKRKDINVIRLSQPYKALLQLHAYEKKHKKLEYLKNDYKIKFLELQKPQIEYVHLIQKKYPNIRDALSDIDEIVTVLSIYALFSDNSKFKSQIEKQIEKFTDFLSQNHLFVKAFISNKGYYFQALLYETLVNYTIPHQYQTEVPQEVEMSLLKLFSQFYLKILEGINYYLQNNECKPIQSLQTKVFEGQIYYLCPEIPKILKNLIISGNGQITDDLQKASHILIDRPKIPRKYEGLDNITFIQPQYIFDSFNVGFLLNIQEYGVGVKLPPHLSPFEFDFTGEVKPEENKYVPDRLKYLVDFYRQQSGKQQVNIEQNQNEEDQLKQQEKIQQETKPLGETVTFPNNDKEIADLEERIKTDFEYNKLAKQDLELQKVDKQLRENISQLSKTKRIVYEQLKLKEDLEKQEKERLEERKRILKENQKSEQI